jgi:hypothetical protein
MLYSKRNKWSPYTPALKSLIFVGLLVGATSAAGAHTSRPSNSSAISWTFPSSGARPSCVENHVATLADSMSSGNWDHCYSSCQTGMDRCVRSCNLTEYTSAWDRCFDRCQQVMVHCSGNCPQASSPLGALGAEP